MEENKLSRQRLWQIEQVKKGLCKQCGKKTESGSTCKSCTEKRKMRQRKYYAKNGERIKEHQRKYHTKKVKQRERISMAELICKQCGHKWTPIKDPKDVRICPACKSSQFDNEKLFKHYGRKKNYGKTNI